MAPRGMRPVISFIDSCTVRPVSADRWECMASVMGVSTTPGHTALTRMSGATASASDRTTLITPALEAA